MTEQRHPEPSVDQLMRRIHAEVEKRRAERSSVATPYIEPPSAPVSSSAGLSPADTDAPAPIALRLQEPEGLSAQPDFQSPGGDRCHVNDLLPFHHSNFVSAAYRMLLRRAPDDEGLRHHLEDLRKGVSKIEIIGNIRYSSEGRRAAVKIEGLAWPYRFQRALRLPVVGGLIGFGVELLNLPRQPRRQRILENRVNELAEQANGRNELALRRIHAAMRELENACNRLVAHAALKSELEALRAMQASKADQSALEDARQLLQQAIDAKAERTAFDDTRKLLRLAIDDKAGREELTTLTNHLDDLVQTRLSKRDLEPIERSVAMLTESVSAVEQGKADRTELVGSRLDATAQLEAARDHLQRAIQSLSETKADRTELETGKGRKTQR